MRTLVLSRFVFVPLVAVSLPLAAARADHCSSGKHASKGGEKKDIVATAVSAGSFSTLVAAAKAAGLVETLQGEGPFTVFAPTDEAFKKLPKGTVEALLKDIPKLKSILLYHVVPGKVTSGDVVKLKKAKTALGQEVKVHAKDGVRINNSRVVKADVYARNGVIHVIDTVLLPASDIVDTAKEAGSFKTLLAAAEAAGLVDTLRTGGPYTVFAPTDEAFGKLPAGTVASLLENPEKLKAILLYHVVPGRLMARDVVKLEEAETALGEFLEIVADEGVTVGGATVVKADIVTGNGVIHVIDSVILPPSA